MAAIVTAQDLVKSYGNRHVLRGVSFAVHDRDRIGLIGANGAGKSTLLKILVGEEQPDEGTVTWRKGLVLEYVAQEPKLPLDQPIATVLGRAADHEVATVAAALQLPPLESLVGNLSLGERRRVALAHALLGKPEVLCLDEPTNHLDARTVEWLEGRLASWQGALVVVTHDRYFLDRVATRIVEVDRGKAFSYEGDYSEFLLAQADRLAVEAETERVRASFVRREIEWIRRGPKARTTKAKARIDRFDAAVAAAPSSDDRRPGTAMLRLPSGPRLGGNIVELDHVSKSLGGKLLFRDVTLVMKPGDRLGIVGPNGAGKTTLIKTILGLVPPDTGRVIVGANTRPAYFEQSRMELRDDLTVLEEVGDGNDFVELPGAGDQIERMHVRSFLRQLAFPDTVADTKIGQLSGGERNRVQLARLLRRGGNLLVLDEPTNDLDLPTLAALEDGLLHYNGCALIVSHDRWFLDRVATGILAFEGEGRVTLYEGSYSFYAERRPLPVAEKPVEGKPKAERVKQAAPRKRTFKERAELAGMEAAIEAAETRVRELEATLSDPAVFKERPTEVQTLVASLDAARTEVERLFARWQELEAIPEA